jgi:hypothetical protein
MYRTSRSVGLVGEWETAQAMEKHCQTREYDLWIGLLFFLYCIFLCLDREIPANE